MEVEETRKIESQCIRDESARHLREKELTSQIWLRFFHSLLDAKVEKLDPDTSCKLPRQTAEPHLMEQPTEVKDAMTPRKMGQFQNNGNGRS